MKLKIFKLLWFSSLLSCMEYAGAGARELDASDREFAVTRLDKLPEDLIVKILEYGFDLAEVSQACRLFREAVKVIIKEHWEKLKSKQQGEYIPRLTSSIELACGPEPSYRHFRELYNSLEKMAGKSPMLFVKPEGLDIIDIKFLLDMDQDVQNLVSIWPELHEIISWQRYQKNESYSFLGLDVPVEVIGEWLGDPKNLLEVNEALHYAVDQHHIDVVKALLITDVDVNCIEKGWSPLINAVVRCDIEIVRLLLESGADPNVADENGYFPLCLVARAIQKPYDSDDILDIVKLLLAFGADVDVISKSYDMTPLIYYGSWIINFERYSGVCMRIVKELLLRDAAIPANLDPGGERAWGSGIREILEHAQQERAQSSSAAVGQQSLGAGEA